MIIIPLYTLARVSTVWQPQNVFFHWPSVVIELILLFFENYMRVTDEAQAS